jgi:carbon storage regulator
MLILTRRTVESLTIGDEVTVTILDVKGIGVTAPNSIAVHRDEIYHRIRREIAADPARPENVEVLALAAL